MKAAICFLAAGCFVVPVLAADPVGFAMWKPAELKQRDDVMTHRFLLRSCR